MISTEIYKAIFGAVGASITLYILYNSYFILKNFRDQEDVAISMFFLQEDTVHHFRVLAYLSIGYSVVALLVVAGIVPDTYPYDAAVLALFGGLAYFLKGIRDVTSGASETV